MTIIGYGVFRLYYGSSDDGRGFPKKVGQTQFRAEAVAHLKKIASDPYSFGNVTVDISPTQELVIHNPLDLPTNGI